MHSNTAEHSPMESDAHGLPSQAAPNVQGTGSLSIHSILVPKSQHLSLFPTSHSVRIFCVSVCAYVGVCVLRQDHSM